jgi:hypothetical protein
VRRLWRTIVEYSSLAYELCGFDNRSRSFDGIAASSSTVLADADCFQERRLMPIFHLNIATRTTVIRDEEGTELVDLAEARREAIKDARGLMSAAILQGRDISHRHIEICNEDGDILLKMPFSDAYEPGD